ncbi:MAG: hypothetical protein HYY40_02560 [Bacteroidetes bacterium]|nr:hypothetical protein [Bacteroidota bacterium]
MNKKNFIPIVLFIFFQVLNCVAQKSTFSPYSQYALGEMNLSAGSQVSGMGGEAYGLYSSGHINFSNPALAGAINPQSVIFETGISGRQTFLQHSSDTAVRYNHVWLSHLAFGFPVFRWWKAGIGFFPYSRMGYNIRTSGSFPNTGIVNFSSTGSGEMDRVSLVNAFTHKGLSAGFTTSYLFGDYYRILKTRFESSGYGNTFGLLRFDMQNFSDVMFTFGGSITGTLGGGTSSAGVFYEPRTLIRNEYIKIIYSVDSRYFDDQQTSYIKDTVYYSDNISRILLPERFGAGLSFEKDNRWIFKGDFAFVRWSGFYTPVMSYPYRDSRQYSTGVQYSPGTSGSEYGFWKATQYRFGIFLNETPYSLHGIRIMNNGMTFGMGFPVRRSRSRINFALELGRTGTFRKNLYRDDYIRLNFILSMNDKWFIREKID